MSEVEKTMLGDVSKWETEAQFCREMMVILQDAGATDPLPIGQVLEPSASPPKLKVCVAGATASCILLQDVTAAALVAGDVNALCMIRGPAVVDQGALTIDSAQLAAAVTALEALNILAREGPVYENE